VDGCAFCSARLERLRLWESPHYHVLADEYPRCVGHVLLLSKPHLMGHMDAPAAWLPELCEAQRQVRRFLLDTFGEAGFWEHGGPDKEVPHAHLHGVPVDVRFGPAWVAGGQVQPVAGWPAVWAHHERTGAYVYAAGSDGAYLVHDEPAVLVEVRRLVVQRRGGETLDAAGGLRRLGPEAVTATRALWRAWAARS
jgi:diadenosine tetraphosphate (Ap4A) HIT family hydrolase